MNLLKYFLDFVLFYQRAELWFIVNSLIRETEEAI